MKEQEEQEVSGRSSGCLEAPRRDRARWQSPPHLNRAPANAPEQLPDGESSQFQIIFLCLVKIL